MNNQNSNIDNSKLIDLIVESSGGKINRDTVSSATGGDLSKLMSALGAEDRKKLEAALSDENTARQLLSGSAAQRLLGMLFGGGKG